MSGSGQTVGARRRSLEIWRQEIDEAVELFIAVSGLGGVNVGRDDLQIDYLPAPHRPPSKIPSGKMAVYAFWGDGCWLKVGKVGPNSHARYSAQHYSAGSATSTLAGSMARCPVMAAIPSFEP